MKLLVKNGMRNGVIAASIFGVTSVTYPGEKTVKQEKVTSANYYRGAQVRGELKTDNCIWLSGIHWYIWSEQFPPYQL